jgi:hypothetical protein
LARHLIMGSPTLRRKLRRAGRDGADRQAVSQASAVVVLRHWGLNDTRFVCYERFENKMRQGEE